MEVKRINEMWFVQPEAGEDVIYGFGRGRPSRPAHISCCHASKLWWLGSLAIVMCVLRFDKWQRHRQHCSLKVTLNHTLGSYYLSFKPKKHTLEFLIFVFGLMDWKLETWSRETNMWSQKSKLHFWAVQYVFFLELFNLYIYYVYISLVRFGRWTLNKKPSNLQW